MSKSTQYQSLEEPPSNSWQSAVGQTTIIDNDRQSFRNESLDIQGLGQLEQGKTSSDKILCSDRQHAPRPQGSWITVAATWVRQMTIFKALLVIYCLNVVAWGGMIFLLMCNAAPAMCHPTCDHIDSPRKIWIEIDSQILNALFCIPAFWLAPVRCTEAWKMLQYITSQNEMALRQLAGTYRQWFRMPGSQLLPAHLGPDGIGAWLYQNASLENTVPYPVQNIPDSPLSERRAMPTRLWKLQAVIGLNLLNTIFQAVLSLFMWCYNRHNRPGWSVGLFLCLAFVSSIFAGVVQFVERRTIRRVEEAIIL